MTDMTDYTVQDLAQDILARIDEFGWCHGPGCGDGPMCVAQHAAQILWLSLSESSYNYWHEFTWRRQELRERVVSILRSEGETYPGSNGQPVTIYAGTTLVFWNDTTTEAEVRRVLGLIAEGS
jgi:hypothetical protein